MSLRQYNTLVLNADFRPLSYFPLSVWPWEDAVNAVFKDRVTLIETYDRTIRSPSMEMQIPSVVALKEFQPLDRKPAFTRFNVFLRDDFHCQYCRQPFQTQELTFDHVVPRSYGGKTTWENICTACSPCNARKGNKTLRQSGLVLARPPRCPTVYELNEVGRRHPPNFLHQTWIDYLYWDSHLEA